MTELLSIPTELLNGQHRIRITYIYNYTLCCDQ